MNISQIQKTCQVIDPIRVTVEDVPTDADHADVEAFALAAVGETRGSLFAIHSTIWPDGLATVTMYRD